MKYKVYLAGKIRHCGWREAFSGYREHSMDFVHYDDELTVNDEMIITGPFFISCDHGCYHGDGTHGVGARLTESEWSGCLGDFFTREDVVEICKYQIDMADIVFAYIDCFDCYGTLAEIGYAHAKGKTIIIQFSDQSIKENMWFLDKMQQKTIAVPYIWVQENLVYPIKKYLQDIAKPNVNASNEDDTVAF